MWLDRPQWKPEDQRQTLDEWRDQRAERAFQVLKEDSLALDGACITDKEHWQGSLAPRLRQWVKVKGKHHLHLEVREKYTQKVLYGPLKIYVHDLAQYMFDTDTVWAFVEHRRAEAQRMFDEENA